MRRRQPMIGWIRFSGSIDRFSRESVRKETIKIEKWHHFHTPHRTVHGKFTFSMEVVLRLDSIASSQIIVWPHTHTRWYAPKICYEWMCHRDFPVSLCAQSTKCSLSSIQFAKKMCQRKKWFCEKIQLDFSSNCVIRWCAISIEFFINSFGCTHTHRSSFVDALNETGKGHAKMEMHSEMILLWNFLAICVDTFLSLWLFAQIISNWISATKIISMRAIAKWELNSTSCKWLMTDTFGDYFLFAKNDNRFGDDLTK